MDRRPQYVQSHYCTPILIDFFFLDAEPEERDSFGRTAFHVSLQYGHLPVVLYFLKTFEPHIEESLPVIVPPKETTLVLLALESVNPTVVTTVIQWHLATLEEIQQAWEFVWGEARDKIPDDKLYGGEVRKGRNWNAQDWKKVKDVLMKFGRFTPPPTPTIPLPVTELSPTHIERPAQPPPEQRPHDKYKSKKHLKKPRPHLQTPQLPTDNIKSPPTPISSRVQRSIPRVTPSPTFTRSLQSDDQQQQRFHGESRGRGRRNGRGCGKGRGRGGTYQINAAGRPEYQGRSHPAAAAPS